MISCTFGTSKYANCSIPAISNPNLLLMVTSTKPEACAGAMQVAESLDII
jgi:hypothetical protein